MPRLDHVNIRTTDLGRLTDFYRRVLGLEPGPRPPFPFAGAWLYGDGLPVVHLVKVDSEPPAPRDAEGLRLEHYAFRGDGTLEDFVARLKSEGIAYDLRQVPGGGCQVNIWDPDGNHLHVDYP